MDEMLSFAMSLGLLISYQIGKYMGFRDAERISREVHRVP